jgi:hypothetical protein
MNQSQIWEVLQVCLFASEDKTTGELQELGFDPLLIETGIKLNEYLKSK